MAQGIVLLLFVALIISYGVVRARRRMGLMVTGKLGSCSSRASSLSHSHRGLPRATRRGECWSEPSLQDRP